MIDVTRNQIEAAQRGDATAENHVLSAMSERIDQVSRRETYGRSDAHFSHEDLSQEAHLAVWQGLSQMRAADPAAFFSFADEHARRAIGDARRTYQRSGVGARTARRFEHFVSLAGGDVTKAVQLAQDKGIPSQDRMSASMAAAAAAAWLDHVALTDANAPQVHDDHHGAPEAKTGRGALLWALDIIESRTVVPTAAARRTRMLDALREVRVAALTGRTEVSESAVDALADTLAVTDRVVADAFGVISRANAASAVRYARHAEYVADNATEYVPNVPLRTALKGLPERERMAAVEHFKGLDDEIVAESISVPATTVRSLVGSAVLRLRAALTGVEVPAGETKTCTKCKVTKSRSDFYAKGGVCKSCKSASTAAAQRAKRAAR